MKTIIKILRYKLFSMVFILLLVNSISAQSGKIHNVNRNHFLGQLDLTEDQKTELRNMTKEMWLDEKSYKEIKENINSKLAEWGIEIPQKIKNHLENFENGPEFKFLDQITELEKDHKILVKEKMKDFWKEGFSRGQMRSELETILKEYEIDLPEGFKGRRFGKRFEGRSKLMENLSTKQRAEMRKKVQNNWKEGKSRKEIRLESREMLKKWSIDKPQRARHNDSRRYKHFNERRHRIMESLTDDQRAEIRKTRKELRDGGKSRREIHNSIRELIDSYGLNPCSDNSSIKYEGKKSETSFSAVNYPNPFNPSTTIYYSIPFSGLVQIRIFDIQGNLIKTLINESKQEGSHSVLWNGKNENGMNVSSGIYMYRIDSGNNVITNKIIFMK